MPNGVADSKYFIKPLKAKKKKKKKKKNLKKIS